MDATHITGCSGWKVCEGNKTSKTMNCDVTLCSRINCCSTCIKIILTHIQSHKIPISLPDFEYISREYLSSFTIPYSWNSNIQCVCATPLPKLFIINAGTSPFHWIWPEEGYDWEYMLNSGAPTLTSGAFLLLLLYLWIYNDRVITWVRLWELLRVYWANVPTQQFFSNICFFTLKPKLGMATLKSHCHHSIPLDSVHTPHVQKQDGNFGEINECHKLLPHLCKITIPKAQHYQMSPFDTTVYS